MQLKMLNLRVILFSFYSLFYSIGRFFLFALPIVSQQPSIPMSLCLIY